MISFHTNMKGTDPFAINSGVGHKCVLATALCGTFFALLLPYAVDSSVDSLSLHTGYGKKLLHNLMLIS